MHKQAYIPPGAGKNFLSLHCLWQGNKSMTVHYKEHVNEYAVHGQRSTLYPFHGLQMPKAIEEFESYNPGIVEWLKDFRNELSKNEFLTLAEKYGASRQGLEVFKRDWYWLPIFDFSIYFEVMFGKNEKINDYLIKLMSKCWEVHNIAGKDLTSLIHYRPDSKLDNYTTKKEIHTMCISFKDCEEYISDLLYVKHSTPAPWETIMQDHLAEERMFITDPNTKADVDISYSRIFKDNNINELRRLYRFFGHEDYFNANARDIVDTFKAYNDFNENLIKSFDFSNVPGYDKEFHVALKEKFE